MARQGRPPHPDVLTPAEWRVLEELRAGGTYVEIAVRLAIQVGTVKFHARNMREKLHLETREQLVAWPHEREGGDRRGALAPLALFTSYWQPTLSTAVVVVVGGATIAIGVLAWAIANTGEPPEDPATTATHEEGRNTAASTSSTTPMPTASPVAPSPTPRAPESSGDVPAIHFWGDVREPEQVAIRARTASIVGFFEARYGVRVPDLEVHAGADEEALHDATESTEGTRAWVGFNRRASSYTSARLDELEADSPTSSESFDTYDSLAALAVGWLIQQGGEDSLIAYYQQLPSSEGWTKRSRLLLVSPSPRCIPPLPRIAQRPSP